MEDALTKVLENPLILAAIVLVVLGGVSAKVLLDPKRAARKQAEAIDKLLAAGKYDQAASLALSFDRQEEAMEYYLRAQQPARAAQLAVRLGKTREAADLYERAGDLARACQLYEQAGMKDKAEEMRRLVPALAKKKAAEQSSLGDALRGGLPPSERPSAQEPDVAELLRQANLGGDAPKTPSRSEKDDAFDGFGEDELADLGGPASAAPGSATDESPEARARRQSEVRERADELLAAGDLQGAADLLRDGGLDDEAVHLYMNVLGQPAEAAKILAKRGEHERAAELYEVGGDKDAAARAWADAAKAQGRVEQYVERIERLSKDVALDLLEVETAAAPLGADTAGLHYALAMLLERLGEVARALQTLVAIQTQVGSFRDVGDRITRLQSAKAVQSTKVSGQDDAFDLDDLVQVPPPPPGPMPRTQSLMELKLSADELSSLAHEVAVATAEELKNGDVMQALRATTEALGTLTGRIPESLRGVGLEQSPLALDLAFDSAVRSARGGPSAESLRRYIGGRPCDLANIEVFYRLGLAQLADGQWEEAAASFDVVEDVSPGYRDAANRADQVRAWQNALGSRRTALTFTADSHAGAKQDRYELKGELGRGGMAVVYRAKDAVLGRDVALKFMSEEMSGQPEMSELFQREARSVAQLNHPNIITLYEFGELEGRLFISMEFLEGKPVDQKIEKEGKLPVVEALRITRQMLEALEYAHDKNIIHRDIKPSNTFLTTSGVVKLMDFGLAKSIEGGTKSSLVAGTPGYMAPEQLRAGSVDQRSDLFSVGCALYEMLTGKLPFEGMDRTKVPPPPSALEKVVPDMVDKITLTAVALDPHDRFQTAGHFLTPIREVLDQFAQATPKVERKPSVDRVKKVVRPKRPIIPRTDD